MNLGKFYLVVGHFTLTKAITAILRKKKGEMSFYILIIIAKKILTCSVINPLPSI